jgi:hypothetical protein
VFNEGPRLFQIFILLTVADHQLNTSLKGSIVGSSYKKFKTDQPSQMQNYFLTLSPNPIKLIENDYPRCIRCYPYYFSIWIFNLVIMVSDNLNQIHYSESERCYCQSEVRTGPSSEVTGEEKQFLTLQVNYSPTSGNPNQVGQVSFYQ